MVIAYPEAIKPVGIAIGWLRHEDISQAYYRYVRMTEGPVIGVRFSPYKKIHVGLLYNPLKRVVGTERAKIKTGQFLLSLTYAFIGGEK